MYFENNIVKCLNDNGVDICSKTKFTLDIIWEANENSIDDIIYMYMFKDFDEKVKGKHFDIAIVAKGLNRIDNYAPKWAHISKLEKDLFLIKFSSQYREAEELCYQELGYPPFKFMDPPIVQVCRG